MRTPENFKSSKEAGGEKENYPALDQPSRREFLKLGGAGFMAYLLAGRTKEAAAALEAALAEKETKERTEPRMAIDIFYGAHMTGEDMKGLADRIKKADVFAPELLGWNERYLNSLSDLAEGKITPRDFFKEKSGEETEKWPEGFEPFVVALVNAIYNSRKKIAIFDVPLGHSLYGRLEDLLEYKISPNKPFPELLKSFKEYLRESANIQLEREQYMLRLLLVFKNTLAKGLVPEVRNKKETKILLFLGAAHTGLYHRLQTSGEKVSRSFPVIPFIIGGLHDEAIRRFMFKKEVSDDLIARSLFWNVLWYAFEDYLGRFSADTHAKFNFFRKAVRKFSLPEIEDVFTKIREGAFVTAETLQLKLSYALEEKGVPLPSSAEELKTPLKKNP